MTTARASASSTCLLPTHNTEYVGGREDTTDDSIIRLEFLFGVASIVAMRAAKEAFVSIRSKAC